MVRDAVRVTGRPTTMIVATEGGSNLTPSESVDRLPLDLRNLGPVDWGPLGVHDEPMDLSQYPILEYDPDRSAVIEAAATQSWHDAPTVAVACFLPQVVPTVFPDARELVQLPSLLPLWEVIHDGHRLGVFYPGQGAPLAATTLERVIAGGCRAIVACGGAGTLGVEPHSGEIVIVDAAVRDEGTSFHYLPPAREVETNRAVIDLLESVARQRGATTRRGKTWTTDGLFRETLARVRQRVDEGCILVEMEAAALLAVGEFRDVPIGVYLSAGDEIAGPKPNESRWRQDVEMHADLLRLAASAAIQLAELQHHGTG